MTDFENAKSAAGFSVKLWRGERMCLIGMDVDQPEPDLVGFSIEVCRPGQANFMALRNRLNFSYPAGTSASGARSFLSTEAPFQKFRWIHFPKEPQLGAYKYRVTKQHMPVDGKPKAGQSIELDIPLEPVTYDGFLDVGFTRNFASSQAYAERFQNNPDILPAKADQGLEFVKPGGKPGEAYEWLGFEAGELIFDFLKAAAADNSLSLDVFAYDLNEPDILAGLEKMKKRLRIIIDNSAGHGGATSAESKAAARLAASAGAGNVKRMHFSNLQHNKVFILRRNGAPEKVLLGSTNFSFRGLYIQANNVLVLHAPEAAGLFASVFERAFPGPAGFSADPLAKKWHLVQVPGKPVIHFCFSPHSDSGLSLNPAGAAMDQASSSVFFAIAFLSQTTSGAVRKAIDRLMTKPVFSYGISDKKGGLVVKKPDGSEGVVSFSYLAKNAPPPFQAEWSGGSGISIHHKFVVTDFNLPTAKVFTGSSNLAPSGEEGNGDHLVMIEDRKVATAYAIEALRLFDHLHFRSNLKAAEAKKPITLKKPTAISGQASWFDKYAPGSQLEHDRKLFSR